jgi:hypothetical protein
MIYGIYPDRSSDGDDSDMQEKVNKLTLQNIVRV